ncbi:FAD-binding and (Fe-S)-binding domain-containing protein [Conexibacter arvalis]|uniref:FAD/FMN-containing dehydrogenase/Fe-S oxidoreductase n=1 Tax=Conexibacter arvalis TaxID=912552 RepID=A0A840IDF7_9ACTN|nr:FAD-binding and (Fe-S)-binding domain-containing protein [Conexibacter arvalis]MBB4662385.1 FAD/FMN-containing dehydrogenase/Fe-S oxidoreductase [Conexibacter arvalis]
MTATALTAIDLAGLRRRLTETVSGDVRFDAQAKGMYATDASNFRQVPIAVVIPRTLDDVVAVHVACRDVGAPLLPRGCGTSLSGETVNRAVVIDVSRHLTAIGEVDVAARTVTVEPGAINEQVNRATGPHGLIFGPDPSTHSRCTIGGNVGNNSCGIHSLQSQLYGPGPRTSDNVAALDVVTADGARFEVGVGEEEQLDAIVAAGGRKGEIYAALRQLRDRHADAIRAGYPSVERLPRRVSGYNLDELLPERGFNVARALVGTEGTCATVLRATLLLTPAMLHRTLVVVEYDDLADACTHIAEIVAFGPIGLEGLDRRLIENQTIQRSNLAALRELPERPKGDAWLLVQFGDETADGCAERVERFRAWLGDNGYADDRIALFGSDEDGGHSSDIWRIREGGLGSTAFPPDGRDHWPGWEDSAVPPERLGEYIPRLQALYARHGLRGAMYGHFGQGCIHSRIDFDLRSAAGVRRYRAFLEDAAELVASFGGSLSGEHGDGQQRAELLDRQYGPELLEAMREFKRIWDPEGRMNPGKVVDPRRLDDDLRLGPGSNPARPPVRFDYPDDGGDFAHAALRCVGVGECRVPDPATVMCPSFQATGDEQHSTRGRARLLYEMLDGRVIDDGWRSAEVFDALDLCLACKGCTSDCPVHVDMPTLKAEFLHHHYRRRRRPRHAYAFGFVDQAARLASLAPALVNAATRTEPLAGAAKRAAGVDPQRSIPRFARVPLRRWFRRRGGGRNPGGPRVVLWPDTFNDYFHADVGVACVEALEAGGWHVVMPTGHVCCGRPLYDYGLLDAVERYLRRTLAVLREEVRAGTPVVGIEPSCLAVFAEELPKLLPHDDDAARLRDCAVHFDEFVERERLPLPRLRGRALLWGHCHHKATGGMVPSLAALRRMGLEASEIRGGCCGLAGSWGFEDGKHDISLRCGEQALLPAVRDADPDTLIVADGFSCKTQIEQAGTGRRALHLGELIARGRRAGMP